MILHFDEIFLVKKIMERQSVKDLYWPKEHFNDEVQRRIESGTEYQLWYCDFKNQGRVLDMTVVLTPEQYDVQRKFKIKSTQPNLKSHELTYHHRYSMDIPTPEFSWTHSIQEAEAVRKKIYISGRFEERADQIWAAQFFSKERKNMEFLFGFHRPIDSADLDIIAKLKIDLS